MSKALYCSAVTAILCLLSLQVTPYYEGLAFNKFWFTVVVVLPVGLISLLIFVGSSVLSIAAIIKKKGSYYNLVIVALLPTLLVTANKLPFPSYIDGMSKALSGALSSNQIIEFATEARQLGAELKSNEELKQLTEKLRTKHPAVMNLSKLPPRVSVSDSHVSVFYGSALVKHWGFLFTKSDGFPIDHIPEGMYKKVYEGVWVYHDIW